MHSIPKLDISMPARGGLPLRIATSVPFESTCARVRRSQSDSRVAIPVLLMEGGRKHAYMDLYLRRLVVVDWGNYHQFQGIMSSQHNSGHAAHAVGLSDPQYTTRKKRMFEFLTRLRAIGCVCLIEIVATCHRSML